MLWEILIRRVLVSGAWNGRGLSRRALIGNPRLGEAGLVCVGGGTACVVVGGPMGGSIGLAGVGVFPGGYKLLPVVVGVTVAVSALTGIFRPGGPNITGT